LAVFSELAIRLASFTISENDAECLDSLEKNVTGLNEMGFAVGIIEAGLKAYTTHSSPAAPPVTVARTPVL
jgi:hypothetical protein